MRIGIDIDNTMTNTFDYVIKLKEKYYKDLVDNYHDWDTDVRDKFLQKHIEEIWSNCSLKKGCKEAIDKLRSDGHTVIIITYRQDVYVNNSREILEDYLKKNNIIVDDIYMHITDKGALCKELDIDLFIDDKLENLDSVSNEGIQVLQFFNTFEKTSSYKIVKSWDEIYNYVNNL